MRKNIFLKSTFRQTFRAVILVLLIGVASFSFFLRTLEFVAVRAELNELGQFFTSIGFVRTPDYFWQDVSEAAEIFENSPYVSLTERRSTVEGLLHNMQNSDFAGMFAHIPPEEQLRITNSIFYGQVVYVDYDQAESIYRITVTILDALAGYFEYVREGFRRVLLYRVPHDGSETLAKIQNLQTGDLYVFHASYFFIPNIFGHPVLPRLTSRGGASANIDLWLNAIIADSSEVYEEVAFLNHNHHAVNLVPTADMSSLPHVNAEHWQLGMDITGRNIQSPYVFRHNAGRLLDRQDYLNANPVAVVNMTFTLLRFLDIGDTLTIEIPRRQEVHGVDHQHRELLVRGIPCEGDTHVIEVEIVGIFSNTFHNSVPGTHSTTFIYIPASLLPDGMDISFTAPEISGIPGPWFSFMLAEPRHEAEQRFMEHYFPIIADLGLDLALLDSGSQEFWNIVDPLILTLTFNAVVFWIVLVLVSALVVFLFINQRRKEMAIKQALGFSRKRVSAHLLVTAFLTMLPGVVIGGALGWSRAVVTTEQTLDGVALVVQGFVPAVEPSLHWAWQMALVVFSIVLIMIALATVYITSFPVLVQLQGVLKRGGKKKNAAIKEEPTAGTTEFASLPTYNLKPAPFESAFNSLGWVWRQLTRSRVKTVLTFLVAFLFIIAIGWLQEFVNRTETEIRQLNNLAEVWGEIRQEDPFEIWQGRYFGDVIMYSTISLVRDTGYVTNMYMEGRHYRSFFVPQAPDGTFPQNWDELIGYDMAIPLLSAQNLHSLDMIYVFSDIYRFIEINTWEDDSIKWGIMIEFYEGLGTTDFYYTADYFERGLPIPVIMPASMLENRGLSLGDAAFMGYTLFSPTNWDYVPVKIIGVHNEQVLGEAASMSAFIPQTAFELLLGEMAFFTHFSFMIYPEFNQEVTYVREYLNTIATRPRAGLLRLRMEMSDHELLSMVGIARQTLLLLQLIYPIAMGASVAIAFGLGLLLMLQNAKNAAILRVLGAGKIKSIFMLISEQFIVFIAAAAAGLLVLGILSAEFNTSLAFVIGLYSAGVAAGAIAGAVIVCSKTPMRMLQVKE